MSSRWNLPDIPARPYASRPAIWVCLVIYVVVQIAGTVVTVLTWEQGKPVMSGEFFVRLLVMPLLLTGVLCAMHFISYEQSLEETDWWNYLCRKARAQWRVWAREHMAILGSVTLTPEADLGERLLGLEGATPGNPDRVMPLPHSENASESDSRLEQVLERLLTPLVASISRFASTRSFEVLLQSSRQEHLVELQQVWRRLGLSDLVRLSWASLDAAPSMLEQWFASERAPDFRLVLACQLHDGEREPAWSEAAVALLLTSPAVLAGLKGRLKPQARLFRPIPATCDSVRDALSILLRAEQTANEKIRHFWFSRLSKPDRHATVSAVKDAGSEIAIHDVDHAIGKPGPVSALLQQAMAADMVQHGQGAQMIASPGKQGVTLNLVGSQVAPVSYVEATYFRLISLSTTVGLGCLAVLCLLLFSMLGVKSPWLFWIVLIGLVLSVPLQMGGACLIRRLVEDDFYRRLWASERGAR
jgi:hypothetical protein